ncbi:mitochondrial succinate dehydrogenase subunit C [Gorgonomyces haynaldii]|nr:mitochondrial succinate dehydrogenase subunit C [Gorgonomyces haynaldii]
MNRLAVSTLRRFRPVCGVRFYSENPDAAKPTLDIDPFKKAERLKRPIAPHLSIYKPQISWLLSAANRVTGFAVGGIIYLGAMSYAVLPYSGAAVAAYISSAPVALLFLGKVLIGAPFWFHTFNGFRHLLWDTASSLTNKAVIQTGYVVLGLTGIFTLWYAI